MKQYNPLKIEKKWQDVWDKTGLYKTAENPKNPYYLLTMFPYPSGDLHTGHWYAFSAPDTLARYQRMQGKDVLFPMGWDAFGLPAENAAIKRNIPPAEWTRSNIASMRKQLDVFGGAFDWERELSTANPEYYKWTQWLFLLLYKNGLAYRKGGLQNWCPSCQTVLANEQVVGEDNVCERCDTPVVKKELEQWFFKITDYAERLLNDLEPLEWPEKVKTMQRNWIGKSKGALINFQIPNTKHQIPVFTTRPDTLFGATYMVLAPEHPLVDKITAGSEKEKVKSYKEKAERQTSVERLSAEKDKTGVFTGAYAINPVNNEQIPIWVADYVLMDYGTGAIMAVPGHDQRDYEFAKQYDLPIKLVVEPITGEKQKNPVTKQKIVCVVENSHGKILTINWKPELGGRLLVGGSIEEGEDAAKTAIREVKEETGYQDVDLLSVSDETVYHEYYAFSKKTPTLAVTKLVHLKLNSDRKTKTALEKTEVGNFEVQWVDKDLAYHDIHDEQHLRALDLFIFDRVYDGEGIITNSGKYDGIESAEAREKMVADFTKQGFASEQTNYKLRDWLVSRQRYWGPPIPIVYCKKCGIVPVEEKDLPVMLPEDVEFAPTGQSPLKSRDDFVNTECPECKGTAHRETDTLDTFVDSSWYYLRYPNVGYQDGMFDPDAVKTWLPVDHYLGGIEHAILHLLYSRFITKALADHAELGFEEPFLKLSNQGMMLGPDGQKMSKSRGNVVNPDEVINSGYGADAFRSYLLFIGPWSEGGPFNTEGLAGVYRFLNRVWTVAQEYLEASKAGDTISNQGELETRLDVAINKTIKKVTKDLENMSFNTAIAAMMELLNEMNKLRKDLPFASAQKQWRQAIEKLLLILAPFTPHIAEELWQDYGWKESIHTQEWPTWNPELLVEDMVEVVVQVNGKVRATITASKDTVEKELENLAAQNEKVQEYLAGKKIAKTITVPGKLVNFVV
ncbi:MAG: leucine--tRNA ligase [Candidatus Saccharimonadales bacterium]